MDRKSFLTDDLKFRQNEGVLEVCFARNPLFCRVKNCESSGSISDVNCISSLCAEPAHWKGSRNCIRWRTPLKFLPTDNCTRWPTTWSTNQSDSHGHRHPGGAPSLRLHPRFRCQRQVSRIWVPIRPLFVRRCSRPKQETASSLVHSVAHANLPRLRGFASDTTVGPLGFAPAEAFADVRERTSS